LGLIFIYSFLQFDERKRKMHQQIFTHSLGAEFEELAEVVLFQSVPVGGEFKPGDICVGGFPFCDGWKVEIKYETPYAKGGQSKEGGSSSPNDK
jgi:hypothetical protein